ncbi:hypothetical protein ACHAWO_011422 [Cyclotella atomus]|uniref:Uncharacterized protein n=1 Tax=Cyclotella atomus TaxID=382360 RepID=A0ABD3NT73_9STRA
MGTSCAVWFANLYFGFHEQSKLLPRFKDVLASILFCARFVNDVFLIWLGECDLQWKALELMFNDFDILKWECPKLKTSVDFIDLTLMIEGNRVVTKTYQQKWENPYVYIPPHSVHPAGMINGIVFLLLRMQWRQNTKYLDFNLEAPAPAPANAPEEVSSCKRLFLHMQYHPRDIPENEVRQIYSEVCEEVFARELDISRLPLPTHDLLQLEVL